MGVVESFKTVLTRAVIFHLRENCPNQSDLILEWLGQRQVDIGCSLLNPGWFCGETELEILFHLNWFKQPRVAWTARQLQMQDLHLMSGDGGKWWCVRIIFSRKNHCINMGFQYDIFTHVTWLYSDLPLSAPLPGPSPFFVLNRGPPTFRSFPFFHKPRFCLREKSHSVCLLQSGLFLFAWWSLVPSVFLLYYYFIFVADQSTIVHIYHVFFID